MNNPELGPSHRITVLNYFIFTIFAWIFFWNIEIQFVHILLRTHRLAHYLRMAERIHFNSKLALYYLTAYF